MSYWTYLNGTVVVSPIGRTQAEKRYVLDTVLEHLPLVTGSERDMEIHVIEKKGYDCSSSCDEFGERTNNLTTQYDTKSRDKGWLYTQSSYVLVVYGSFRDRMFKDSLKEFQKWLCRLAKRVMIKDVLVEIRGYSESTIIRNTDDVYGKMFEEPSWNNDTGEPNWCEYLMWDRAKGSSWPIMLAYKYYRDEENDREAERRIRYFKEG